MNNNCLLYTSFFDFHAWGVKKEGVSKCTPSFFYAQSPDFHKLGLCYYPVSYTHLKWGHVDICGAGIPYNIDAKLNGAYIVLGLLYGKNDVDKTMEITCLLYTSRCV